MIEARKRFLLFAAIAAIIAISGAAWAGITSGVLSSGDGDVDLSGAGNYRDGTAINPVTLDGGANATVTLTGNLKLGNQSIKGYASDATRFAGKDDHGDNAYGGAILVDEGQTLNITPESGKSVSGSISEAAPSSLRLVGGGTTNLSGSENSYSVTFLQSGRLNVASRGALGRVKVRLAGGSVFGIMERSDRASELDLSGLTIEMTRYDPNGIAKSVTFDTGTNPSNIIKVDNLDQTTKENKADGDDIKLIKDGQGTLSIAGIASHSGETLISAGTLELGGMPTKTPVIEISPDAALSFASNVSRFANIKIRPHSGARMCVPAVRSEASVTAGNMDTAALYLNGIDTSTLQSTPFVVEANLDGLYRPSGADEDRYYVKLLNIPSHGLATRDVTVAAKVPNTFSQYYYAVDTFVDNDNIYALLRKDESAYTNVLDISVFGSAEQGNIINVVVGNNTDKPFASDAGFNYRFIDSDSNASDPLRNVVFAAERVQFNRSRTKAGFKIDLNSLEDENGVSYTLVPGRRYEIAIDGAGGAGGSTGLSVASVNSAGNVTQPDSGRYIVNLEAVSVDLSAGSIKSSVIIKNSDNRPLLSGEGLMVNFNLCDAFGDDLEIKGIRTEYTVYASGGYGSALFEKIPAGHYFVKISSPEFPTVKYSEEIVIPGSGGGGGGCDTGAGLYAFAAVCGVLAVGFGRRKRG